MSGVLYRLLPSAGRLVTPELASGKLRRYGENDCATFMVPLDREVVLGDLDAVVVDALERFRAADPAADAHLAVAVHRALRLSRREAADPGVFRYLTVIRYPELVRHRWEYRSFATMRTRFWRAGTRHDANAFARWWWIAELTRDGDDYALTREVLQRSALATHVFSRSIASYRPAIVAIAEVLGDAPGPQVEAALKNLGKMLSVRVLEALDEAALRRLLGRALSLAAGAGGR